MSDLLDALITRRREGVLKYKAYLNEIIELARKVGTRIRAPILKA